MAEVTQVSFGVWESRLDPEELELAHSQDLPVGISDTLFEYLTGEGFLKAGTKLCILALPEEGAYRVTILDMLEQREQIRVLEDYRR